MAEVKIEFDYPSNSNKEKAKKEQKNIEKVVTGEVKQKKKPLSKKFAEAFLNTDGKDVGGYILYDVLIPAAKNTITDMVSNGIEMLLYGEAKGSRTRRDKGKSYVSYSSYYDRDKRETRRPNNRATHNFDDIIIESRGEAEEVLSRLVDIVEEYGVASVADLYELVGLASSFTDNKYGWDNLGNAYVSRTRDGYIVNLPRTIIID